ncbi:oligodendrocyte-myelin glycoprotein-like isoform X1 [Cololabis saira]|uniref:oligodendrocyte-myelin glycoprotein-like isoform X1 n=1 Tax=Cololabis saira TaxID=129043 RepID=UPI002AD508CE|nr:oligodendrocyte-myelin glycoprotein-like isoform X1 [Cololabis saira]
MRTFMLLQSSAALLVLLLCGLLGGPVLSICPSVCLCSGGHRVVDCSSRGLTKLPPGLQHNIRSLNLSFNSLQRLGSQLSNYGHLRTLDLSYNRLESLPTALPRSLWDIRAAGNHLRWLDKNDTAYHWNLKALDLSDNDLERVVFINNTLLSLQALNLSQNRFWTVPTNMPHNLESIDLSHNYLAQILPASLDRLPRLVHLYLHANRFSWLPEQVFDKLTGLEMITLGDNPWACEDEENTTQLLKWAEQTRATVLGCPCYISPVCGQIQTGTVGRERHSALFTEPPFWGNGPDVEYDGESPAHTAVVTTNYRGKPHETGILQDKRGATGPGDQVLEGWTPPPHSSTTARMPSSTIKPKISSTKNRSHAVVVKIHTVTLATTVMTAVFTNFWTSF